jgi:hypothetical protein
MLETCCDTDAVKRLCPSCGRRGARIGAVTVEALTFISLADGSDTHDWFFCAANDCTTVYFSGERSFTVSDVRVPVLQKTLPGGRLVCYCLQENEAALRQEVEVTGTSRAVERVREFIATDGCACEVRNPKGSCCLGDVIAAVKRLTSESGTEAPR